MDGNLIQRLDQYIAYAGLNDNRLTVLAGLKIGIINSARKRQKGMGSDNIEKILLVCKDLNARWLLTGEGEMLSITESTSNTELTSFLKIQNKELQEKVERLNREVGDLQRQLSELKKSQCPSGRKCCLCRCKWVRLGEVEYLIPKY